MKRIPAPQAGFLQSDPDSSWVVPFLTPERRGRTAAASSTAKMLPGVHAVLTGRDATEVIGSLPAFCAEPVVEHAMAVDKVR